MTVVRADDGMQAYELERALRALPAITAVHRRLRLFSFVLPRPKEGEGDSLQLALRVEDEAGGRGLLARLALEDTRGVQRPVDGPFAGAAVMAGFDRHPQSTGGDFLDIPLVVLRLWNEEAPYDVTDALVDRAEGIERRLSALHVDLLPRETRLLSWVTRERHPELFD